jgi:hypothetical protein
MGKSGRGRINRSPQALGGLGGIVKGMCPGNAANNNFVSGEEFVGAERNPVFSCTARCYKENVLGGKLLILHLRVD